MTDASGPIREPPPELRSIKQYIQRGNQLRQIKPVITYYLYFWSIKQILANNLHQASSACTSWTADMMDELERRKEELLNKDPDLINDDTVAQAYVEKFALEVFENGAKVVGAGRATIQTRDTLLAAACFLELTKIFSEPDQEIQQKIKFAKFHAARIWKAINQGQDPNQGHVESVDTPPEPLPGSPSSPPPQPSVVEIPDEPEVSDYGFGRPATPTILEPESPGFAPPPQVYQEPLRQTASTIVPTSQVHTPISQIHTPPPSLIDTPSFPTAREPSVVPMLPSVSPAPSPPVHNAGFPVTSPPPQLHQHQYPVPYPPEPPAPVSYYPSPPPPFPPPPPVSQPPAPHRYRPTEEEIARAQKHARWAISALEYEDIETAVKELMAGLKVLGA